MGESGESSTKDQRYDITKHNEINEACMGIKRKQKTNQEFFRHAAQDLTVMNTARQVGEYMQPELALTGTETYSQHNCFDRRQRICNLRCSELN